MQAQVMWSNAQALHRDGGGGGGGGGVGNDILRGY